MKARYELGKRWGLAFEVGRHVEKLNDSFLPAPINGLSPVNEFYADQYTHFNYHVDGYFVINPERKFKVYLFQYGCFLPFFF